MDGGDVSEDTWRRSLRSREMAERARELNFAVVAAGAASVVVSYLLEVNEGLKVVVEEEAVDSRGEGAML